MEITILVCNMTRVGGFWKKGLLEEVVDGFILRFNVFSVLSYVKNVIRGRQKCYRLFRLNKFECHLMLLATVEFIFGRHFSVWSRRLSHFLIIILMQMLQILENANQMPRKKSKMCWD